MGKTIDWTAKRREFLIRNGGNLPVSTLADLPDDEFIIAVWGEDGAKVVDATEGFNLDMTMDDFLKRCTMCGGNWGGMFLSGLKEVARTVWDAIPDDMGVFAFGAICRTMHLCGIHTEG